MAKIEDQKLYQAIQLGSFKPLVAYPRLLNLWARTRSKDIPQIARIAGHRINNHTLCRDKCHTIDKWTKKLLINQIAEIINQKATAFQLSLLPHDTATDVSSS